MDNASTSVFTSRESAITGSGGREVVRDTETGRSNWLSFVFWLLEQPWPFLLAIPTIIAALVAVHFHGGPLSFAVTWLAVPLLGIGGSVLFIVYRSRLHDAGPADWRHHVSFRDPRDAARWSGKKIPMEILYEAYIQGKLDFTGDLYEVMLRRNQLFRFCFTWGDWKYYFRT